MENKPDNSKKDNTFTEQDLKRFISRIIACGIEKNIRNSLSELGSILQNEGVDFELQTLLHDVILASQEMAELGKSKGNTDITDEELGKALRESRERIRREESFRC